MVVMTSCSGQDVLENYNPRANKNLSYSTSYKNEMGFATAELVGNATTSVGAENQKFEVEAKATISLLDTVNVEEFSTPSIKTSNLSDAELSDWSGVNKTYTMAGTDLFSDGQSAEISANWIFGFIENNDKSIDDCAHLEINDIVFKNAELSAVENNDRLNRVTLNYEVSYSAKGATDSNKRDTIMVSPYYYQQIPAPEITVEKEEPYFFCDTIVTVKNNAMKCKFIVYKVTPKTLQPADTVKVAQKTLTVAEMGLPGDETLKVFNAETSSNNYTKGEVMEESGSNGGFSWISTSQEHNFRAEWNHNGLEVGHTDILMLYGMKVTYKDENCEYHFDFTPELKVVQNEVVNEQSTEDGYLGTRVLSVEGYCNGVKFTEGTGRTTLLQHE
jgi:hypothetical protein